MVTDLRIMLPSSTANREVCLIKSGRANTDVHHVATGRPKCSLSERVLDERGGKKKDSAPM